MENPAFEIVTDADRAARALDEIAPLYEQVFAEPPYFEGPSDLVDFLEGYGRFRTMAGFRLVLARSGGLVGFAFGVLLQSGSRWWDSLGLDAEFTRSGGGCMRPSLKGSTSSGSPWRSGRRLRRRCGCTKLWGTGTSVP
ncbi:hypothetical protein [Streptomyces sp. NRRL WC-3742]|uniref:hypothetical protein n=1 Tax=Streptomyces sp. NRRL WC-3742 TaxID=1463934 RepID=UPI00068CD426|nr:hypothetical protein [Streptomyces sp. NRRL WC-3742]